jgi:pilus assembly protein CpaB
MIILERREHARLQGIDRAMKTRQIQLMGIVVALGALLFIGLLSIFKSAPQTTLKLEAPKVDTTEVLVARTDIGIGQLANQGNFRWQSWPSENVSPAFISRANNGDKMMQDLTGSIVRSPITAGEPITSAKLIKVGQGGVLAAILPKGMRAISTRIKEETAAGRLILPNDRVDVILIRRLQSKDRGENFVSDTMFRNVRVLAIGQQIETKDGKKTETAANTATLELTPRQSELLALANSMGEISLTLRPLADLVADGSQPSVDNPLNKERGNSVKMLRYGVKSRAYGVN